MKKEKHLIKQALNEDRIEKEEADNLLEAIKILESKLEDYDQS